MDTLIKFRQKVFGNKTNEVVKFIKSPQGLISTTALTVSGANLATNASRHRSDKKYQAKLIDAMNELTKSLTGLNKTVKDVNKSKKKEEHKKDKPINLVSFRPKLLRS